MRWSQPCEEKSRKVFGRENTKHQDLRGGNVLEHSHLGWGCAEVSYFVVVALALIWLSSSLELPWLYYLSEAWREKDSSLKLIHS